MRATIILAILLFFAVFVQVSWVPVPLGLLAIFWVFTKTGTKYIIIPVLAFSLLLAFLSQTPSWLVLAATIFSLYLFILGKSFLPSRLPTVAGLVVVSLFAWEVFLASFLRIFKL